MEMEFKPEQQQQSPEHQHRRQKAKKEVTEELAEFSRQQKRDYAVACYRAALRNQILPAIAATGDWNQPLDEVWGARLAHMGVGANELDGVVMEEVMRFGGVKKLRKK